MQEITTLFTAIGDFFTKADWFTMVKWPFWILLGTVAAGGVYCARFGKKTLLNQGVFGVMNLLFIYLIAISGYIRWPSLRSTFSALPFLSETDQSLTLLNPLGMDPFTLSATVLRLLLLILLINLADRIVVSGKTIMSWLFSQIIAAIIALLAYAGITACAPMLLPCKLMSGLSLYLVVFLLICAVAMICTKLIFTVFITGGNPYYSSVYKFFTVNKAGSLLTTSAVTFLLAMIVLTAMQLTGNSTLTYPDVNRSGLRIIGFLLLVVMYIFCMYYNDKKKS